MKQAEMIRAEEVLKLADHWLTKALRLLKNGQTLEGHAAYQASDDIRGLVVAHRGAK